MGARQLPFNHGSGSYALDSHGRGARGAAVRLDSCRLVVAQVARTGKIIRLPIEAAILKAATPLRTLS